MLFCARAEAVASLCSAGVIKRKTVFSMV